MCSPGMPAVYCPRGASGSKKREITLEGQTIIRPTQITNRDFKLLSPFSATLYLGRRPGWGARLFFDPRIDFQSKIRGAEDFCEVYTRNRYRVIDIWRSYV